MFTATPIEGNTWAVSEIDADGQVIALHKVAIRAGGTGDDAIAAVEEEKQGPSPEEIATQQQIRRVAGVKLVCRARIYRVADEDAQINLASNAAGGLLTLPQMTTYRSGLVWVIAMRAACALIASRPDLDENNDANWPVVPFGVPELAALF